MVLSLNEVIHSPVRLVILIFLQPRDKTTFPMLQKALNLTGGNLSSHLSKLAKSDLINMRKMFIDTKPTTIISLTPKGRNSITDYANSLSTVLKKTLEGI